MIWYFALRPDDAKQDPVVYRAEFGVFLVESPCAACIQEGLDCLGRYHSVLEGERNFRLVVELPCTSLAVWIYSVSNETILYLQPSIPPKRFDIFPPVTGGCSEGLGVV